jgi:small conductance mechanosensitive channel
MHRFAALIVTAVLLVALPHRFAVARAAPIAEQAATGQSAASGPTAAEIESLVRTLKDDGERQKLIGQLEAMLAVKRAQAAPPPPQGFGGELLSALSSSVEFLSRDFVGAMRAVFDVRRLRDWAMAQLSQPEARARWIAVLWKVAVTIAAGFLGEWIARRPLAMPRRALEARAGGARWRRILPLMVHALLDVAPVAVFFAAAYATLAVVQPDNIARLVALAFVNAYVVAGLVLAAGRAVLSPASPALRLPPIRDDDANYLYVWLRRIGNVTIYGYAASVGGRLLGLPADGAAALLHLVGLFVALMLMVFTLQNRAAVAERLRGGDRDRPAVRLIRARLADIWHVLAIVYIIGMYVVWALAIRGGFEFMLQATVLTALILAVTRLVLLAMHRSVGRVFALSDDVRQRYPGLEARANRYLPVAERAAAVAVYVVTVFALLEAWGIDSFALLATEAGRGFAASRATSLMTVAAAAAAWEIASAWIERYLERETADGSRRSARARTLLPLLRTTLMVVLIAMATLVVLSQFGVDIAPLLAGAGVIGLAIGFGSQALVRDVITGAFILAEDQLSVGDVVKVGSNSGVVERLTLRTIWLRGLDGTVQVVPFGEVKTVENMTKDFSCYVFDVQVAYREDTDRVIDVLKEIGDDLQKDAVYGPMITAPLEVFGVNSFGDSAVSIQARITTRPIQQWKVGREFNRRMKKRFDAEGIEMPYPHRTVYFGVDREGKAPPARVLVQGGGADAGSVPGPTAPAPAAERPE